MIKINLLPFRAERKKENIRRELSVYSLSMVFLFTLLIYFSIALNNRLSNLQTERANKATELRRYSDVLKKIKSIKKKERELKSKINTIRKIARLCLCFYRRCCCFSIGVYLFMDKLTE